VAIKTLDLNSNYIVLTIQRVFRWKQIKFSITEIILYIDITTQKEVLCV